MESAREELYEKYCLGRLTEEECDRLKGGLRGSRTARLDFARFIEERGLLVQFSQRRARTARWLLAPPKLAHLESEGGLGRQTPGWLWLAILAAVGAVLGAALGLSRLLPTP